MFGYLFMVRFIYGTIYVQAVNFGETAIFLVIAKKIFIDITYEHG
ncbi:hypothetical protein [Bartonella heixiaziensis]